MFLASNALSATSNAWTNTSDGLWQSGTNWSGNVPPDSSFSLTVITNANSKTVTIDSATPPATLAIQKLTISAPSGSTNILQLLDLTTNSALQLSSTLAVDRQGVLAVSNSAVNIDGFSGGILNVSEGEVIVDDGLVDVSTTTSVKIGSSTTGTGRMTINNGTMLASQVQVGSANGTQGVLTLSNSLVNAASIVTLADGVNSSGVLSIYGGQFVATNDITRVANFGHGDLNLVEGLARFAFLSIADNLDSTGTVSISGGEMQIVPRNLNDYIRVGNRGTGSLNISGGSNMVFCELHIADVNGYTGMVMVAGGLLNATNGIVSIGRYGVGFMTLSGGVTVLTNSSVGRHEGAVGTLLVQNNAVLNLIGDLSIGRFPMAIGHMEIEGGLVSSPSDSIWVGRQGTGDLTVSGGVLEAQNLYVGRSDDGTNVPNGSLLLSGGTTLVSDSFIVGSDLLSTGQVVVAGGSLAITNDTDGGMLDIQNGTFEFDSGEITADVLLLTNPAAQMTFNSGALELKSAIVSNGVPFVVGDGVSSASLELLGGTCSFANGLVISSNATITGCGTILGDITNYGTIATNCGSAVTITGIRKTDSSTELTFTTLTGANHLLQYNDALVPTNWTTIEPGIIGNGSVMTNYDTNAAAPARFYRIEVQ